MEKYHKYNSEKSCAAFMTFMLCKNNELLTPDFLYASRVWYDFYFILDIKPDSRLAVVQILVKIADCLPKHTGTQNPIISMCSSNCDVLTIWARNCSSLLTCSSSIADKLIFHYFSIVRFCHCKLPRSL